MSRPHEEAVRRAIREMLGPSEWDRGIAPTVDLRADLEAQRAAVERASHLPSRAALPEER